MPKPASSSAAKILLVDEDDPDLNSTSTNAALLPGNNGYLCRNPNSMSNSSVQPIFPLTANDEDNERTSSNIDVIMAEMGSSSSRPTIEILSSGSADGISSNSRHATGGDGTRRKGGRNNKNGYSCFSYLREYRCQLIFVLIAFIEFGILIAGITFYFAGVLTASCDQHHSSTTQVTQPNRNVCLTEECVRTASSLLAAMDTTADPCTNFFQYACGTWNKKHVIPEDRSSISTFEVLADQQQLILKSLLEEPISRKDDQGATIKAKKFYASCMDIQQIRAIGDEPLKEVLRSLGGWPVIESAWKKPKFSKEQLFGRLRGDYSESVLIEIFVGADDKNSSVNIIQLDQLVLALPSQDYYLKASSEGDLQAYHKYMVQIAVLLGANLTRAQKELQDVVKFEMQLANASLPEADRHDTSAIYKKLSLRQLQREVPQINWREYIQAAVGPDITIDDTEQVVCYAMPYMVEMGRILADTDDRIVHNYVLWRLVMSMMTHMIDDFQRERVEFRKILLGIQSERHRWSQCVEWTNKKMGMAVGALFIRDNFKQDSKETALEMIHTIREAFNELLAENHWMDDETRAVAKEKADAMNERIGYPDILTSTKELEKEYENLTLTKDHFMNNILYINKWDAQRNFQLLRKPVDKDRWATEPAVVNAFYSPNKNDIVFPAGILQPLFYSSNFPKSLNYGGIGVVIGHEITHGFDDKGRQFDKDGNMMQWWNDATIRAFRERAQCIIDQYSRFKVEEVGLFLNGRMTQGENIADNGGLKQSFRAYRKWVRRHGPEPELPGLNLTHDQLFFLNYAQIWCGTMRPEDAINKIRSSVHSPGVIRVIGPLSNSKDFAEAYKCPLGTSMNPVHKCNVW